MNTKTNAEIAADAKTATAAKATAKTTQANAEKVAEANDILSKDETAAQTTLPAGVEDIKRHAPPPNERLLGRYDLAAVSNALNNVLNLRNIADKDAISAEFEAQLVEILDASAIAPEKWNKMVSRDASQAGQTYEGHTA